MGLREIKKRRVRDQIIESAIALFRERGFDATPVREIAAAAEISDATFFNYFATKDAVLSSWVHALLEPDAAAFASADAYRSLRPPLRGWVRDLARRIEEDRELMVAAWSRLRVVATPSGSAARAGEAGASPLVAAFREAQGRGEVRADLPAEQLARLLRAALACSAGEWLCGESGAADSGSLDRCLLQSLDLVLDGGRKRHERVRMGAAKGRPAPAPASPASRW
ncbi:MAG: TetR/AcrR family transcriptional regulator [Deltaproteobacteria bacterium]|nr:TetR/AcrR family transcriptional regulator [Deltaproteobacteria bacterium]